VRRALPLALVAVVLAGCGGGSRASLGDVAAYAPSNAEAFVSFRTDANWHELAHLVLGRVPRVGPGVKEAAFALVHGNLVAVAQHGTPPPLALAENPAYKAALASIPHGASGLGYVRGDVASTRLHAVPGLLSTVSAAQRRYRVPPNSQRNFPSVAVAEFRWGAAWLTGDGIDARLRSAGLPVAETQRARSLEQLAPAYHPALFDEIPADAQSVLDLTLGPGSFELLPKLPDTLASQFDGSLIGIAAWLDQVILGETALYTRKGGEVTLVTQPGDTEAARKVIAQLVANTIPAVRARPLHVATIGGQLVVSTSRAGIAVFRGGGAKLSTRLDLPDQVTSVVYSAGRWTGWTGAEGNDPTFTLRFSR
jgi:hypothetical protein